MRSDRFSRRGLLATAGAIPAALRAQAIHRDSGYVDILRAPDLVTAFAGEQAIPMSRAGARWQAKGIAVHAEPAGGSMPVRIEAPAADLSRVHLRWRAGVPERWRILNDQWERSYGDLEWRGLVAGRVLPWYFMAYDGQAAHAYGVATGGAAFAFWQVDADGISLWIDVRCGGSPVRLGDRVLEAATVMVRRGNSGETPFESARQFCRALCRKPRLPAAPVYGGNNWYYAYGQNCSAEATERDAALIAELSPPGGNRPFMVIDDGWSVTNTAGPWDRGNNRFPDMPKLAASMRAHSARPGIWMRPLCTTAPIPDSARLRSPSPEGTIMDPTIPEMLEQVRQDVRRMVGWGFEMVKHDYSSFDLLGRWGPQMGAELTGSGWHFQDRSRTTAEVALALYQAIRDSAGGALLIGCNTFGHLAAGLFELQRTGDDTSGRDFNRTRRMGVNTLAFRAPQHRAFFDLDADCAAITPQVPWELSARWLDLVARSGTALFVSPDPAALNAESKAAMRRAFDIASRPQPTAEPLDWMQTTAPRRWRLNNQLAEFDWYGPEGAAPFPG